MWILVLENLKRYGSFYVIFALLLYCLYLTHSNARYQEKNALCHTTIELQNKGIQQQQQIDLAQTKKIEQATHASSQILKNVGKFYVHI